MDRSMTQDVLQALNLLGSLADLTRTSLEPLAPSKEVTAPIVDPVVEEPQFTTSTTEYAPALQDRSVIHALLGLKSNVPVAEVAPLSQEGNEEVPLASFMTPELEKIEELPSFEHAELPQVEATPKASPYFRRTPGPYSSILRSIP